MSAALRRALAGAVAGFLAGFLAGLAVSEIVGIVSVVAFEDAFGIRYLPVMLAAAGALAAPLLARRRPARPPIGDTVPRRSSPSTASEPTRSRR